MLFLACNTNTNTNSRVYSNNETSASDPWSQAQYNQHAKHNVRQGVFRTNDGAAKPRRVGEELKRLGVAFPGDGHRQTIRVAQQGTKVGAEQCGQHVCGRGRPRK